MQHSPPLAASYFRLTKIFSDRGWLSDLQIKPEAFSPLYRCLEVLHSLHTDKEREMFFSLLENFERFESSREIYRDSAQALQDLITKQGWQSVTICPLRKPKSNSSSAGSQVVVQEFRSYRDWRVIESKVRFVDELPKSQPNRQTVVVDDFSGSGSTILKHWSNVAKRRLDVVYFVMLAQDAAIRMLKSEGVDVHFYKEHPRAFDVPSITPNGNDGRELMQRVESRFGIARGTENSLGYAQSEALLRFTRTPNNTLPIFWTTRKLRCGPRKGTTWPAPFPRLRQSP